MLLLYPIIVQGGWSTSPHLPACGKGEKTKSALTTPFKGTSWKWYTTSEFMELWPGLSHTATRASRVTGKCHLCCALLYKVKIQEFCYLRKGENIFAANTCTFIMSYIILNQLHFMWSLVGLGSNLPSWYLFCVCSICSWFSFPLS